MAGDAGLIPTAAAVHEYLKKSGAYDQVKNWFLRRTAYPVVVVGASGAGKSALIKSLFGEPSYISRLNRSDEVKEVIGKLEKTLFIKLIDTPGEQQHEAKRKSAFRRVMRYSSVGIINVVSYGYHEGKYTRDQVYSSKTNSPSEAFLDARRDVERTLVKEWTELLCGDEGPAKWVTTVATKADLWWIAGADQPVLNYYDSSPYLTALGVASERPHSVKSYASVRQLFFDTTPMSGYYSDQQRKEDHVSLIGHILEKASQHA